MKPTVNRSILFSVYNKAKAAAKKNSAITLPRLNKALSLIQSGKIVQSWELYHTKQNVCGCPDHATRGNQVICKHRLALMMAVRMYQKEAGYTPKGKEN